MKIGIAKNKGIVYEAAVGGLVRWSTTNHKAIYRGKDAYRGGGKHIALINRA